MAMAGDPARPILLVRGRSEEQFLPLPPNRSLHAVAAAQTTGLVASVQVGSLVVHSSQQSQSVWSLRSPANSFFTGVAFSPDQRLLAIGTNRDVTFFEVGSWRQWAQLTCPPNTDPWGVSLAWSADGSLVACQESDHVVRLLDRSVRTELLRLEVDPGDKVKSLAFSDDGSLLIAGTRDGKLHGWNLGLIRRALALLELDWSSGSVPEQLPDRPPLTIRYFVPRRPAANPTTSRPGPATPNLEPAPQRGP